MTPEEIRIIIAEACGWTKCASYNKASGRKPDGCPPIQNAGYYGIRSLLPDYPNDLNAMHEAEKSKVTVPSFWQPYQQNLEHVIRRSRGQNSIIAKIDIAFATAEQRAEAFVRTIGKWKE